MTCTSTITSLSIWPGLPSTFLHRINSSFLFLSIALVFNRICPQRNLDACAGEGVVTLNVATGEPVTLNHLGPVIVTPTGGLRRVTNWNELTGSERKVHKLGRFWAAVPRPRRSCAVRSRSLCTPLRHAQPPCMVHVHLPKGTTACASTHSCMTLVSLVVHSTDSKARAQSVSRSRAPWVLGARSFSTDCMTLTTAISTITCIHAVCLSLFVSRRQTTSIDSG
jgi:hypothetical protein